MTDLTSALEWAMRLRQRLYADQTTFYRLLHHGEGVQGLTLEHIGTVGVLRSRTLACSPARVQSFKTCTPTSDIKPISVSLSRSIQFCPFPGSIAAS